MALGLSRSVPPPGAIDMALRPGDRVLQIGGGLGPLSAVAARAPQSVTVAVYDPRPRTAAALRQYHAVHGRVAASIIRARVAPDASEASGASDASESVPLATALRRCDPTLLVIDAGGQEAALLAALRPGPRLERVLVGFAAGPAGRAAAEIAAARLSAFGFSADRDDRLRPAVLFHRSPEAAGEDAR